MHRKRNIAIVVKKGLIKDMENDENNLEFWLSKSPNERVEAITTLVMESLKPGTRMDRTAVFRKKIK